MERVSPQLPSAKVLGPEVLRALHRTMVRIRRFDERTIELFLAGQVKGTAHSCVGQEAIAAGACAHLTRDDFIVTHHRGHGHTIAKGADTKRMMAELMGRVTGYCRGLGGSSWERTALSVQVSALAPGRHWRQKCAPAATWA
jgi:TPP-dependent pyruvate/acetoin dehydrogenase alpha subunit